MKIVRVTGGCQDYNDTVAMIGPDEVNRRPDEGISDFEKRVMRWAKASRAAVVIFGAADSVPEWRKAEGAG